MTKEEAKKLAAALIKNAQTAVLSTIDPDGFPVSRAMLNLKGNSAKTVWFTTNISSQKIPQLALNEKASVYFTLPGKFDGLLLTGTAKVFDDQKTKNDFWEKGWELYYPGGATDPDFCMVRFDATQARVYSKFQKIDFKP